MSTYYKAFLGIGKRLASEEEVKNFLKSNTCLTDEQIECMIDGGKRLGISVERLDWVDYFVGFEVDGEEVGTLICNVVDAQNRWNAIFKEVSPRVVHDVKAW